MRLVLVGADYEENLGMCMIAAGAEAGGHRTAVVPFGSGDDRAEVVRRILALRPDVVGLAAQFQHRGLDYLGLACDLRRAGFRGHVTAGGQFATMAAEPILAGRFGIDSVVLYEGERTIGELLDAVGGKRALAEVAGLSLPDGKGGAFRTAVRPLAVNLDDLPLAHRYRQHSRQVGIPFIPVSGGRGCWAGCAFCSITSVLRDGRAHGVTGRRLRLRSPEDVGLEMAMLAQAVGGSAVFCFHDENFLLPRPAQSLERIRAIRKVLDEQGVARAAFVGKCRPDTVTPALAGELASLGVIRMYVGIENTSESGTAHLNRGTDVTTMAAALDAFADAGIFVCYNLLVFEPETTLADVAKNIAFMRAHATTPINFCRAEPYLGTPMYQRLRAAGRLQGGFLGCDYRIADDRAELLFRITGSAFREHNFACEGVANRYMSLGYTAKLLEFFYPEAAGRRATLMERAQELTRSITLDTADRFEQALDLAASADLADHDYIARQTALLGLRVAASDRLWHAALDTIERDMAKFARGETQVARRSPGRMAKAAQGAAVAGWLALWSTGCGSAVDPAPDGHYGLDAGGSDSPAGNDSLVIADALPADAVVIGQADVDMAPQDTRAFTDGAGDAADDGQPGIDGALPDGNRSDYLLRDDPLPIPQDARDMGRPETDGLPPPSDARDVLRFEVDPLPGDALGRDYGVVDMAPADPAAYDAKPVIRDAGSTEPPFIVDPVVESREGLIVPAGVKDEASQAVREHWALTSPVRLKRSQDLPLCLCPEARLSGEWQGNKVRACLASLPGDFNTRWQAQGEIEGVGDDALAEVGLAHRSQSAGGDGNPPRVPSRIILWTPSSDEDQLDVAVRTRDGVAVTLLRLEQVAGKRSA
jgi:anaerobic magnesium-protoporphyrin IX monomethyl ester cyclase